MKTMYNLWFRFSRNFLPSFLFMSQKS